MASPAKFSTVGKKKFVASVLLLSLDLAALVFAARVNNFQEYYFVADLLPLGLSIVTCSVLLLLLTVDILCQNAFTARPPFEIGTFFTLCIFWLASNIFSTFRWRYIPFNCASIPSEYPDERIWCRDVQALKAIIWILLVVLFSIAAFILRYAIVQSQHGNKKVWTTPLSRYDPRKIHSSHPPHAHNRTMSRFTGAGVAERSFMSWEEDKM